MEHHGLQAAVNRANVGKSSATSMSRKRSLTSRKAACQGPQGAIRGGFEQEVCIQVEHRVRMTLERPRKMACVVFTSVMATTLPDSSFTL
eukprot:4776366-Amphidinium_carterae.1